MKKYDVCIIGAGPSGFAAAIRAIDLQKKVCLVERNKLGGAGVYNGALSSKTMWELSQNYKIMKSSDYGYFVYDSSLDYTAIVRETRKAENEKYQQLKEQLDYYVGHGLIDFYHGKATVSSQNSVAITGEMGEMEIETENIVLAIGSRPRQLPNIEVDEKIIMTSDGILSLNSHPESIVILGAGVIGCEYATIFSNFGKTKVYLIDKAPRILPFEDDDISETVANNLISNGVHIHRRAGLASMKVVDGKVRYTITYDDGREEVRDVDKALISVGRVPNFEGLGLEKLGVEINSRGFCVDKDTRSSVPNIYAVGDFTADIALVNIAELEGRHAIERMFGEKPEPLSYKNISTIMFLNPEVAAVGMNEQQAREKGLSYRVAKMDYKYINRAIAMRAHEGFIKIIVSDDDDLKLLGLRVLGEHASSTIESVSLLIAMEGSVRHLANLVLAHPSIPEGIQECARMLMGTSILKPEVFNNGLQCYRVGSDGHFSDLLPGKGLLQKR